MGKTVAIGIQDFEEVRFVLGLLVELQREYVITSNRESGFGRYDVMIEPKNSTEKDAIILEFKVHDVWHCISGQAGVNRIMF